MTSITWKPQRLEIGLAGAVATPLATIGAVVIARGTRAPRRIRSNSRSTRATNRPSGRRISTFGRGAGQSAERPRWRGVPTPSATRMRGSSSRQRGADPADAASIGAGARTAIASESAFASPPRRSQSPAATSSGTVSDRGEVAPGAATEVRQADARAMRSAPRREPRGTRPADAATANGASGRRARMTSTGSRRSAQRHRHADARSLRTDRSENALIAARERRETCVRQRLDEQRIGAGIRTPVNGATRSERVRRSRLTPAADAHRRR